MGDTGAMINLQSLMDDAKCFATVRDMRWPDGVQCPHCDSPEITCNGLRISELMLENIICSQLELNENETGSRLELIENELELNENSLRTSVSARIN